MPAKPSPSRRALAGSRAKRNEVDATQRIVESITTAIVERRLMPGTKLGEQRIADLFSVSRTLVRQALHRLGRDRLVTMEPARGARVATPSIEEARQVFEARALIETEIVRRLAARITPAQVAALRAHLCEERAAVKRTDVPGRTRLLADFHVVLALQLGNQVLAGLLGDLLGRSSLISLMYQSSHSAGASQSEHEGIVDALEAGDARAAARLMVRHLEHVEQGLRAVPETEDLEAALMPGNGAPALDAVGVSSAAKLSAMPKAPAKPEASAKPEGTAKPEAPAKPEGAATAKAGAKPAARGKPEVAEPTTRTRKPGRADGLLQPDPTR